MTGTVVIMAGGTGGHVFPALALARELGARGCRVVWLGTRQGIEARLVPAEGLPVEWISIGGLRGKGLGTLLAAPFRLVRALYEALRAMRRHRPVVVVGLGGFVTGPGGIAAWLARRPLVIHEQNAIAGYTNRVLARFARDVLTAFPDAFDAAQPARVIGNPVRPEFFALGAPADRAAGRGAVLRLLVVGGSQGATKLNAVVPFAVARLAGSVRFEVRHQAGPRWIDAARKSYADAGADAKVMAFIDDIAEAYAWADLVICRSGALTVSELAAAGVASILVPFPAAVDDHQTANARFLVREGAALLLLDRELTAERLARELLDLCRGGRERLLTMADRARRLARPRATVELADACLAVATAPRAAA
ncbi:MAG: undecaprenyldiphospho-muramoylpentapeptide beta-N-acetylglucosaminyltransferase [Steroidobacteraceae bacterium]